MRVTTSVPFCESNSGCFTHLDSDECFEQILKYLMFLPTVRKQLLLSLLYSMVRGKNSFQWTNIVHIKNDAYCWQQYCKYHWFFFFYWLNMSTMLMVTVPINYGFDPTFEMLHLSFLTFSTSIKLCNHIYSFPHILQNWLWLLQQ